MTTDNKLRADVLVDALSRRLRLSEEDDRLLREVSDAAYKAGRIDGGAAAAEKVGAAWGKSIGNLGYPADWPRCACGLPVLDGHLTCGQVQCNESGARYAARGGQ